MLRDESELRIGSEDAPGELWHRASRVRQLVRELADPGDIDRMNAYALELEERARQADRLASVD